MLTDDPARPGAGLEEDGPPFSDHFLDTAGSVTRYWDVGEGPPLVLLHGIADSVIAWWQVLPQLSRHFRCIALDMPGFGLSTRPARISPELYLDWLDDVLDGLGIERALIVGHSLGGQLAALYALSRPQRVAGLSLVSAAGLSRTIPPLLRLISVPWVARRIYKPSQAGTRRSYSVLVANPAVVPAAVPRLAWQYASRPGFTEHMVDVLQLGGHKLFGMPRRYVFDRRLAEIAVPLQIMWGARDPLFPVAHARQAAARRPDADLVIFDDVAHIPMLERPDDVAGHLARFAARVYTTYES